MPSSTHQEQVISEPATGTPTERPAELAHMNPVMIIDLAVCGVLIAVLSFVAQHFQPDLPRLKFFTGLVGGLLCILWAVLGRRTKCCRLGSIVILVAVAGVLLVQAVQSWQASIVGGSNDRRVPLLISVRVFFCVGMLANLAREKIGLRR